MKKGSPSTLGLLYRPTPALALESAGGHSSNHSIPLLFSRSKILGVAGPEPELAPGCSLGTGPSQAKKSEAK